MQSDGFEKVTPDGTRQSDGRRAIWFPHSQHCAFRFPLPHAASETIADQSWAETTVLHSEHVTIFVKQNYTD